jgi:hypothetical protein
MGRNITRFADRPFFHTVDLTLLERLLAECNVDVAPLPADRAERVNKLFELFYRADEGSIELHEALYCIMRLDNHHGMTLLIDLAAENEVQIDAPVQAEAGAIRRR